MKQSIAAAVCALVLCAVPSHAKAQIYPAAMPIESGPPRFAALPTVVTPANSGIMVSGRGVVRAHADVLHFNATLGQQNGPPVAVDTANAAAAIVEALKKNGIPDAAVAVAPNGFIASYAPAVVNGSLRNPTRQRVNALFGAALAAAAPYPAVALQNLNFGLTVDDCTAAETRASTAAVADARARAERFARAAGVTLGRIMMLSASGIPSGACATRPDEVPAYAYGPIDPNGSPDVTISANVTVTFAIR